MERKIGEIFEYDGEWYQCVESYSSCEGCDFKTTLKCSYAEAKCSFPVRQDHTSVIFKKLEKVGEQFLYKGKQMQSYIRATDELICNWNNNLLLLEHGDSDIIDIEIKQNKEDMGEENDIKPYDKYFSNGTVSNTDNLPKSNLKPFNLEAAKAGEPVCTRDGRPARIICFNRVSDKFPIIALVMGRENREDVFYYDNNGKDCYNKEKDYDLVMKPKVKTGWINVHKENGLYETEEDAKNNRLNDDFVAVKVEFEI